MKNNLNSFDLEAHQVLEIINKQIEENVGKTLSDTQATILILLLKDNPPKYEEIGTQLKLKPNTIQVAAINLFKLLNKGFPELVTINKRNIKMNLFPIIQERINSNKITSEKNEIDNKLIEQSKEEFFNKSIESQAGERAKMDQFSSLEAEINKEDFYELPIKIPVRIIKEIDEIAQNKFLGQKLRHSEIILDALESYIKQYHLEQSLEQQKQKEKEEIIQAVEKDILEIIGEEIKKNQEKNANEIKVIIKELTSNILTKNNSNLYDNLNERLKCIEAHLDLNSILENNNIKLNKEKKIIIEKNTKVEEGLNDSELASLFGTSQSTVKRWRLGSSKPRGNNLKRLKKWEIKSDRWYEKK